MPRSIACLAIAGLLSGCAAPPRPGPDLLGSTDSTFASASSRDARAPATAEVASLAATDVAAAGDPRAADALWRPDAFFAPEPAALAPASSDRTLSGNYVMLKAGPLYPEDSDFDTGAAYNAAFGRYINSLVAVEFETGYLVPDPKASSTDVWGIPLLINARVCVPIWLLELYGGGGIGTMYYDFSSKSVDATGWLASGDLFLGADVQLFDKLMAGLELKYYITDKLRNTSDNLNAFALMVTFGWKF